MAADDPKLRLNLVDVYGKPLGELVDIDLRHQVLSEHKVARRINASKRIVISGLRGNPQGLYRMEIDPPGYLPVSQFVNMEASGFTERTITFPVDPKKVSDVKFPNFKDLDFREVLKNSSTVLGFEGLHGEELYKSFDKIRKAGLFNIFAKSRATPLSNGKNVLSYIKVLHELRGDRFFASVPKELREETKNSVSADLFHKADSSLHHPPASFPGFSDAGSFKTNDSHGNLQLSFFMKGDECLADIDIDDAGGIGHIFQVLRNALTHGTTHPYNIHEILMFRQQLDPGYTFIL
jgi:hypothetical protein